MGKFLNLNFDIVRTYCVFPRHFIKHGYPLKDITLSCYAKCLKDFSYITMCEVLKICTAK